MKIQPIRGTHDIYGKDLLLYRFIEKSPLDKAGWTNTADFGIGYSRSFGDINILSENEFLYFSDKEE